jgi:hypothetical protein
MTIIPIFFVEILSLGLFVDYQAVSLVVKTHTPDAQFSIVVLCPSYKQTSVRLKSTKLTMVLFVWMFFPVRIF